MLKLLLTNLNSMMLLLIKKLKDFGNKSLILNMIFQVILDLER